MINGPFPAGARNGQPDAGFAPRWNAEISQIRIQIGFLRIPVGAFFFVRGRMKSSPARLEMGARNKLRLPGSLRRTS